MKQSTLMPPWDPVRLRGGYMVQAVPDPSSKHPPPTRNKNPSGSSHRVLLGDGHSHLPKHKWSRTSGCAVGAPPPESPVRTYPCTQREGFWMWTLTLSPIHGFTQSPRAPTAPSSSSRSGRRWHQPVAVTDRAYTRPLTNRRDSWMSLKGRKVNFLQSFPGPPLPLASGQSKVPAHRGGSPMWIGEGGSVAS